jgi:hypothetical protein
MARQRYCRRLARYRNTLRVSADPVAQASRVTRAESRGSRPSNADAGERRTLRWREMDSNLRSPIDPLLNSSNQCLLPKRLPSDNGRPGTGSSNPSLSSRESGANLRFVHQGRRAGGVEAASHQRASCRGVAKPTPASNSPIRNPSSRFYRLPARSLRYRPRRRVR